MSLYPIALFVHIVGVLGLFAAIGLEWTSLLYMRRAATVEEVRLWSQGMTFLRRLGPVTMLMILAAGIYMTLTAWGLVPWILVTLVALVSLPVLGVQNGRRLAKVGHSLAGAHGELPVSVLQQLQQPFLLASIQLRTAIGLGIVFLMTIKPDLVGSLITIGTAVILGLASALPAWNRARLAQAAAS